MSSKIERPTKWTAADRHMMGKSVANIIKTTLKVEAHIERYGAKSRFCPNEVHVGALPEEQPERGETVFLDDIGFDTKYGRAVTNFDTSKDFAHVYIRLPNHIDELKYHPDYNWNSGKFNLWTTPAGDPLEVFFRKLEKRLESLMP